MSVGSESADSDGHPLTNAEKQELYAKTAKSPFRVWSSASVHAIFIGAMRTKTTILGRASRLLTVDLAVARLIGDFFFPAVCDALKKSIDVLGPPFSRELPSPALS